MRTESQLIQAIASAGSLAEQASLVAELDALKAHNARTASQDGEIDFGSTIVEAALTPVAVHTMHTAATDWLDDVTMTTEADLKTATNAMAAEASLWFNRTSSDVRADHDEFSEQARGMARRLAGKYGEQAPAAAQAFLDYATFLHRREAASGLDQVQQLIDGNNQPKQTPLPEDTFDTFNPAVDPMNAGVDEMQTSENAPLLNEILSNPGFPGAGQPEVEGGHSDTQQFTGPQTDGTGNPVGAFTGSLVDGPSVALGYTMNLDDFRKQAAAEADPEPRPFSVEAAAGDHHGNTNTAQCPNCGNHTSAGLRGGQSWIKCACGYTGSASASNSGPKDSHGKHSSRVVVSRVVEGASGLPQVQQQTDVHDQVAPTPLPQDVMFPLVGPWAQQESTEGTGEAQPVEPLPGQGTGPQRQGSLQFTADEWTVPAGNVGSANPLMGETANGSPGSAGEPTNAMDKALSQGGGGTGESHHDTTQSVARKTASAGSPEFRKGFGFAANWRPSQPLVKKGSAEFEAGLFAGMRENTEDAQVAWVQRHEQRGGMFARRIAVARKFAATTTDLDTMVPGASPDAGGNTPLNGPGTTPPLQGGMDAAAPGGASPYNGADPYGSPVAPDPLLPISGHEQASDLGGKATAFRQRVQAGILAASTS